MADIVFIIEQEDSFFSEIADILKDFDAMVPDEGDLADERDMEQEDREEAVEGRDEAKRRLRQKDFRRNTTSRMKQKMR